MNIYFLSNEISNVIRERRPLVYDFCQISTINRHICVSLYFQIQAKRELFFKGDNAGIISSPSVPSVPPPQPPSQSPSSVSTSSTTTTTSTTLTSPNTAPSASSTVYTSVTSSAPTSKPRLPPSTVILNQNDASEDSNKRESSRTSDTNKEATVLHHPRPTPPTKSKELDGYVGFANLPNQVYRKAVKKGFDFTLMVVG